MYNLKRNNFYLNEKNSTIYTPLEISKQIKEILKTEFQDKKEVLIFDPCVGKGNLLVPWLEDGFEVKGWDIEEQGFLDTKVCDYLSIKKVDFKPDLVIINPPFNFNEHMKNQATDMGFSNRPLIPEVFLTQTINLFGKDQKIALFTPYGLRLNNGSNAARLNKFLDGIYPEITGIISLRKDVYDDVQFHSEILLFNTEFNKPHYFLKRKKDTE